MTVIDMDGETRLGGGRVMRLPGSVHGKDVPEPGASSGSGAGRGRGLGAVRGGLGALARFGVCCVLAAWGIVLTPSAVQATAFTVEETPTRAQQTEKQREEKSRNLKPETESKWQKRLRGWEECSPYDRVFVKGYHGIHGILSGMPAGGGIFGIGAGYTRGLESERLRFDLDFRFSYRAWKSVEAGLLFPTPRSDSPVKAFIRTIYEDYPSVPFYGIGTDSSDHAKSYYAFKGPSFRAGLRFVPHRRFETTGLVGYLNPEIDPGGHSPSLQTMFSPGGVPGFESQPDFFLYGGELRLNFYDKVPPSLGAGLRFGVERYQDRGEGDFSFTRLYGEATASVPVGNRARRLAFRFRTSHSLADDGNEVPFYLMDYLGGSNTLRAYAGRRFLDTRNLLANIEYRWEVWQAVDFCLFADTGKVFHRRDDFNFSDLKTGYGFGVRVHYLGKQWFRIDLGHGSEGFRLQASSGPSF
jgi:hypothetical protein